MLGVGIGEACGVAALWLFLNHQSSAACGADKLGPPGFTVTDVNYFGENNDYPESGRFHGDTTYSSD